jgi:hypothetical protein
MPFSLLKVATLFTGSRCVQKNVVRMCSQETVPQMPSHFNNIWNIKKNIDSHIK